LDKNISEKVRHSIIATGLRLVQSSMTLGTYGNISARIDSDNIAITPSGTDYARLVIENIAVVDLTGKQISGDLKPSSELPLHLEIYKSFPEAQAVIHTHSLYASALAVAHKDLPPVIEDLTQIVGGTVFCTEYTVAGTKELGERAVKAMHGHNAALLANHGAVCWGMDLEEALTTAEVLEKAAQIYCIAHSFETPFPLNEKTVHKLHEFYTDHYRKRQRGEKDE